MKLELVIEIDKDGHYWGRVEDKGFIPTGQGTTLEALKQNVIDAIEDHQEHDQDRISAFWRKVKTDKIEFVVLYDMVEFFEHNKGLNKKELARRAGINNTLLNHYATGIKYPSMKQVKKIEDAIHAYARELEQVNFRLQVA